MGYHSSRAAAIYVCSVAGWNVPERAPRYFSCISLMAQNRLVNYGIIERFSQEHATIDC